MLLWCIDHVPGCTCDRVLVLLWCIDHVPGCTCDRVLMLLWCIDHVPGCTCDVFLCYCGASIMFRDVRVMCSYVIVVHRSCSGMYVLCVLMLLWCIMFWDVCVIVFLCYCGASIMFRDVRVMCSCVIVVHRVPGCTCDVFLCYCGASIMFRDVRVIVFRDVRVIVFLCYCGASCSGMYV